VARQFSNAVVREARSRLHRGARADALQVGRPFTRAQAHQKAQIARSLWPRPDIEFA
jgi:hypothetical protein